MQPPILDQIKANPQLLKQLPDTVKVKVYELLEELELR
jgi:hypothetical protein